MDGIEVGVSSKTDGALAIGPTRRLSVLALCELKVAPTSKQLRSLQ
jgi:hypothetical protein